MKPRVMVIGLDGATLKLIEPLVERGVMPNMGELLKRGASGVLKSTTPPYTPPAWSSFYTGVNPGKHGIFGFTRVNPATGKRELSNSRVIGSKCIWQILNEHGLRTGLINLPLTYPPEEVDGYMVTGMMTPENSAQYTFPHSIAAELASMRNEYVVDVPVVPVVDAKNTDAVKKLRRALRGRDEAVRYLLENHPCEFVMAVFVTPDRLQHVYWKYIDERCNKDDLPGGRSYCAEILECYHALDESIGNILDFLGGESQVFVISDHGFTELKSEFFLNQWLTDEGFFRLGASSNRMFAPAYRWLRSGSWMRKLTSNWGGRVREEGIKRFVDWENTKAYAREQGLFMNLRGRDERGSVEPGPEADGIRQRIAERLVKLRHPETGESMVDRVIFKEDVYSGEFTGLAPDLIPVLDNYRCYIHDGVLRSKLLEDCSKEPYGAHDPDGVIIAHGPDLRSGAGIDGAAIIDVAPTILHALGLPVPDFMDGKVIMDIFEPEYMSRNPVRSGEGDGRRDTGEEVYSQEEADEIQEQLRGMGYLS